MNACRALFRWLIAVFVVLIGALFGVKSVSAATCTISSATVINQAYVNTNSCTAINIQGSVSTTWIGTVDLGGGIVTVKSTYTMTMGSSSQMTLGANDDLVVETGATITHVAEDSYGVQISARNITVTGSIDTTSKGCQSTGVEGQTGRGPNVSTGICAQGTSGAGTNYAGGSYGGLGTRTYGAGAVSTYGSSTNPTYLGSSGGSISSSSGGLVILTASGTLTINGSIKADGQVTGGDITGGSGGSINIHATTLAGSGTISANGGYGTSAARGGGGGGRIAIYYSSATYPLTQAGKISASRGKPGGGTITAYGANGSSFILDRLIDDGAGTLTFAGNPLLATGVDYERDAIQFGSFSVVTCESGLASVTVSSSQEMRLTNVGFDCATTGTSRIVLSSSVGINAQSTSGTFTGNLGEFLFSAPAVSVSSTLFSFSSASSVRVTATTFTNYSSSTLVVDKTGAEGVFDISSDLTLTNFTYSSGYMGTMSATGSHWFYTGGGALSLVNSSIYANVSTTVTTLSVDSSSTIDASRKGCISSGADGTTGYGPSLSTGICTQGAAGAPTTYGGGGYGGVGAASYGSTAGATYGSSTYPTHVGSSGGSSSTPAGGRILIRASGAISVSGPIRANAGTSTSDITAGSGGTVLLWGNTVTISSVIAANGGSPGGSRGGGGGGRIAFLYSGSFTFTGTSSTSAGTGFTASAAAAGTIQTLQMNQLPTAPTSLGQASLTSGATTGTTNPIFTFTLADADVSDTVKFRIQIDDSSNFGSAVVDYTSALGAQGGFSFQVGQAAGSGSYTAGSNGQTLSDGSYYWRVKTIDSNASESSYATANSGAVAFIVDSVSRSVSFQYVAGSGEESVAATSIRIMLDTAHFESVSVNYAVSSTRSSATGGGTDYTLTSGTATISAGQTSTTIPLTLVDDSIDEPNEIVAVQLSSPTYASLGASSLFEYTIQDNDSAGVTLSKTAVSLTEGGATDSYTVVLASQPTSTVRVTFTTSTYGATLNTMSLDFTSGNWDTPQTVTVSATNDSVDEGVSGTSLISAAASVPTGYAYGYDGVTISDVTATVTDDDTASINLSKTAVSVTEGGAADSYTIVLASQPTSTVHIAITPAADEVTLSSYTLDFTSVNWNTPQTITVTAANDAVDESALETTTLASAATVPSGYAYGYAGIEISSVTATITDNDAAGITLTEVGGSTSVTEGGATDTFTLVLTSQPTSTVRISFTTSTYGVTLNATSVDFTALNWDTPQTITITATNDDVDEASPSSATVVSAVSVPSGFSFGYDAVTIDDIVVSVTDNDVAGVSLSKTTSTATEGGATDSYTLVLNSQPTSTVRIAFTTTTYGVTINTTTLDFTTLNWNTPQSVTITATNDSVAEGAQIATTTHGLTVPTGFAYGYSAGVTIEDMATTIADNDTAGITASESGLSVTEGGSAQTLTYVLDTQPTSTVTLTFTTSTNGITVSPMTMSFTAVNWNTPQALSVLATDDTSYEASHSTTVRFSVTSDAYAYPLLDPPTVTVTITDNDTSSITFSASTFTIREGASDTLTVVLASQPTSTVTMTFLPSNQLRISPTTVSFTSSNWSTPQTLTITPVDDDRYAGTRAESIRVAVTSETAFADAEVPNLTVTITDNEGQNVAGGGAAGGAVGIPLFIPLIPIPSTSGPTTNPTAFSVPSPTAEVNARVEADLRAFKVKAAEAERARFTTFVRFGSGPASQALGEGERRAVLRDALETMRRSDIPQEDLERIASGQIPKTRNIDEERKQVARALPTFKSIFGQVPDFSNPAHNLAWNTLLYRIRFPRDLKSEQQGIKEFKQLFGRAPQDPFQWSVVRVLGYVQK